MQVVRNHPKVDQPLEKLGKHVDSVIDAPQQDGLAQHRHPGIHQPPKGPGHRMVDLGRVIDVNCQDRRESGPP